MIKITSLGIAISLFVAVTPAAYAVGKPTSLRPSPLPGIVRACQARETNIKTRLTHLIDLATNMQTVFDGHATKVEDYYKNVVVPSGKTVINYDTLVAAIAAKKTAVQTAITKAQGDVAAFSCTTENARTALLTFRTDMQAVKSALKEYRTSIKNLIVAIHAIRPKASPDAQGDK